MSITSKSIKIHDLELQFSDKELDIIKKHNKDTLATLGKLDSEYNILETYKKDITITIRYKNCFPCDVKANVIDSNHKVKSILADFGYDYYDIDVKYED